MCECNGPLSSQTSVLGPLRSGAFRLLLIASVLETGVTSNSTFLDKCLLLNASDPCVAVCNTKASTGSSSALNAITGSASKMGPARLVGIRPMCGVSS